MSDRHSTHPDPGEDAFFAYTDRLATGDAPAPANDVEATALRVQQAFGATARPEPTMPPDLKASLWEDIMHATNYRPTAGPLPAPPTGTRRTRAGAPPPRQYPQMMWTGAANIALAILVVALFGTWQGVRNNSDPTEPATLPAVSMQDGTPAPESAVVTGSPEASPAAISDCDLSGDIPLVTDLRDDEHPVPGTVLYVVQPDYTMQDPRGILKLGCEGEKPVVLAEDVIGAWAGPWPGIVSVSLLPPGTEDQVGSIHGYIDIRTGMSIQFAAGNSGSEIMQVFALGSPWVIGGSSGDPGSVVLVNLRTMERRPLADVIGAELPIEYLSSIALPAEDGKLAIGVSVPVGNRPDMGRPDEIAAKPKNLIILGDSFADIRWIDVPELQPRGSSLVLSPDGTHAAVVSMEQGKQSGGSLQYGVIDLSSGTRIGQSTVVSGAENPLVKWIQKGSAIAYVNGSRIETIAANGDGQPVVAYEAPSTLYHLQTTYDPDVVVASTRQDHGSDASASDMEQDMVYSVNVRTGETHEFAGIDASASVGWNTDAVALVMYEWEEFNPETTTYTVYDPVTGEQIGEIADAPPVQVSARTRPTMGPDSVAVSADGMVEVIGIGTQHIYAFSATSDGLTMTRVESPEGLLSNSFLTANIFLSPDGSLLSLNGEEDEGRTRYVISLDDSDAEWIGFPNEVVGDQGRGLITFVDTGQD